MKTMIKWIQKIVGRKPNMFNREGVIVQLAFSCGGIDYYEVSNVYGLPMERGRAAVKVYQEVQMKCDYDYLKGHALAVDNIFSGKKIGAEEFFQLKKLNDALKERLFKIIDTDIIYKLASVVFFDKNESPYDYDPAYAAQKVAHWKKHSDVNAFFLSEPMTRLIPFLKLPDVDFQTYSDVIRDLNKINWEYLFTLLSPNQKSDLSRSKDFFVEATPPSLQTSKS